MSTLGEKMTREEVQEMVMEADGNNNGNINYKGTHDTTLTIIILKY